MVETMTPAQIIIRDVNELRVSTREALFCLECGSVVPASEYRAGGAWLCSPKCLKAFRKMQREPGCDDEPIASDERQAMIGELEFIKAERRRLKHVKALRPCEEGLKGVMR